MAWLLWPSVWMGSYAEVCRNTSCSVCSSSNKGGTTALSAGLHPVCMLFIKFNVRKKFLPVVPFFSVTDQFSRSLTPTGCPAGESCSDISDWSSRPLTDCPHLGCCPRSWFTQLQILGSPRLGNLLERLPWSLKRNFTYVYWFIKRVQLRNSHTGDSWGGRGKGRVTPLPAHHPPSSPVRSAAQIPKPCCWDFCVSLIIRCDLSHWPLVIELVSSPCPFLEVGGWAESSTLYLISLQKLLLALKGFRGSAWNQG